MALTVGVLGPLDVRVDGRPVVLTAARLRNLLCALAMSAGRPVPLDRLVAAVWGDELPGNARRGLQTYVTRLRAHVGPEHIAPAGDGGYLLAVDPQDVDALAFVRLLDAAPPPSEPQLRRAHLAKALALWRGAPFEDVRSPLLHEVEAPRLVERHLSALEGRIGLDLAGGRHDELVAELATLTAAHPLRESLWALRLAALRRAGRDAEALETYEAVRALLADQLGVDPGAELQRTYAALLSGEKDPPANSGVPRQLPPDVAAFTGRERQVANLDELATSHVTVLHGPPGVGKTTLAVHWAHRVTDRFPDGQLFIDLHGHSAVPTTPPSEALARLLRGLGVPPEQVPLAVDEQAALYRTRLAGRRVLIVLDNASSAAQVRPLLPGEPRCVTVVTSRGQHLDLVALDGARHLPVDVLEPHESHALLTTLTGVSEPEPVARLAELCGHLPLALRIAGAYLSVRPHLTLAGYADRLSTGDRLAALSVGDDAAVRSTFDLSYRALPAPLRAMFRALGLHPGADVSADAAAALAGTTAAGAEPLLERLADASLLHRAGPGRFGWHDLVRLYATQAHAAEMTPSERAAAVTRLFDHYLGTARNAIATLHPEASPLPDEGVVERSRAVVFTSRRDAMSWLDDERANLVAVAERAGDAGRPTAWLLADTLFLYLLYHDHAFEWRRIVHSGLKSARRTGHRRATAAMLNSLGTLYGTRGDDRSAIGPFEEALPLFREAGDRLGECRVTINLGNVLGGACRFDEARAHLLRAIDLARGLGDDYRRVTALATLGVVSRRMGRLDEARGQLVEVLAADRATGDRRGESITCENLGTVYFDLGRFAAAEELLTRSIDLIRASGQRSNLDLGLNSLAALHLSLGRVKEARDLADESLRLSVESGVLKAEANALSLLAACDLVDGRPAEAADLARRAHARARQLGDVEAQGEALIRLAGASLAGPQPMAARGIARQAMELSGANGLRVQHGRALTVLAAVTSKTGDRDGATDLCHRALAVHRETGSRPGEAQTLRILGRIRAADDLMHELGMSPTAPI